MNSARPRTDEGFCPSRGFTLIELLTVIAIIAILAGLTFAVFPRVIEKAKIRRVEGAIQQIRTAMVSYMGDHATYPPAYGFLDFKAMQRVRKGEPVPETERHFLKPYLSFVNLQGSEDYLDEFSESRKTSSLGLLNFSPVVGVYLGTNPQTELYDGDNLDSEVQKQLEEEMVPFIYAPVNMRQFQRAKRYWIENGDFLAKTWSKTNTDGKPSLIKDISFPASSYDAFVLISAGPARDYFGLVEPEHLDAVSDSLGSESDLERYHVRALRTFFLATRDLNDNNRRDFDFVARTRQGEGAEVYFVPTKNGELEADNELPYAKAPNGYGPLIFVVQ